jgi:hypothetical protein
VISPALVIIALLVRLQLGSPVLFKQVRPGLHGKPFTIYKFRTMTDARDKNGDLLPDAQRLTKLGRFLRSTSLDELPELWNVIKGDMSLVGPRPLLMQYLDRYTPVQARRHEVKPGSNRMGAGERSQCHFMGGKVRAGCLVCGSLLGFSGYSDYFDDTVEGVSKGGYSGSRGSNYAGIFWLTQRRKGAKILTWRLCVFSEASVRLL